MKKIKLTAKEAKRLAEELGLDIDDGGTTFYATNEEKTEIWDFDTKKEREEWLNK